jgi:hypothetical protein
MKRNPEVIGVFFARVSVFSVYLRNEKPAARGVNE